MASSSSINYSTAAKSNQSEKIISACNSFTRSCINFSKIDNEIISIVNHHYFDLQMYANFIFDIENENIPLSAEHNFYLHLEKMHNYYQKKYPQLKLFDPENMTDLLNLVLIILEKLKDDKITKFKYLNDLQNMKIFGYGATSATILCKAERRTANGITPLIIKIVPLLFPHQYQHLPLQYDTNEFINTYMDSPSYAIYFKEAWMYCFSKDFVAKYTPTFTCISNCYIIEGLPIKNFNELNDMYQNFALIQKSKNKKVPYKLWFDYLIHGTDPELKNDIFNSNYGCFEMSEIEGTFDNMQTKGEKFNLGMIFEYLYSKVVCAFIGRIIFTDDHFGNIAYKTVNYIRHYKIKCNGCDYHFYIPPGRMIQFIDLERYVFNFSPYDIYTNSALKYIPNIDYLDRTKTFVEGKKSYLANDYISDKTLSALGDPEEINAKNFETDQEYIIMLNIIKNKFIYDIKSFCQVMDDYLPSHYKTNNEHHGISVIDYYLDLDDDNLRVIKRNEVYENML